MTRILEYSCCLQIIIEKGTKCAVILSSGREKVVPAWKVTLVELECDKSFKNFNGDGSLVCNMKQLQILYYYVSTNKHDHHDL